MTTKTTFKVVLEGRGPLTLRRSNHVATGGEGSVYRAARTIVKVYLDPDRMEKSNLTEKIKLLSQLKHEYIVSPRGLVFSSSGKPIGLYMPYVNGEPLPRVFTNDFRTRERFSDTHAKILAHRMSEVVEFAHGNGAVLVDANELNWLAVLKRNSKPEPRIIDVDSWSIGRWPASVVMPSIRDWHTKSFNELTDWFTWGIVTFQVFTGIHPYKGRLDGFKAGDLHARMKANASVFTPEIRLNRAVRDFSSIPGPLLDWYIATFQNGERSVPPSPLSDGAALPRAALITRKIVSASGSLVFTKLFDAPGDRVVRVWSSGVVLLESGSVHSLDKKRKIGHFTSRDGEVVETNDGWLLVDIVDGSYEFRYVSNTSLEQTQLIFGLTTKKIVRYEDRLFSVTERGLTEFFVSTLGKPLLSIGKTWGVMVNATRWFDGVGVQDAMGATYLVAPFGDDKVAHVRVPELDDVRVVSAKAGNRFISVMGVSQDGTYHKFELSLDKSYTSYILWRGISDSPELNISILPRGVCATVVSDGDLVVFVPSSGGINHVLDKQITTDICLSNLGNQVVYVHNGALWSVRMK